jgi:hypothetical protein
MCDSPLGLETIVARERVDICGDEGGSAPSALRIVAAGVPFEALFSESDGQRDHAHRPLT